ncbi:unnamed protein product [Pedinophyceae sp. YPF-701]|nr:unnamed protein product [Pedinophyceae sp. YPF-701]
MFRIKCQAKDYAWGLPAGESEVAGLAEAAGEHIDGFKPYAELWMGTHPSGPSTVAATGANLRDWLQANSQALGEPVIAKFGTDLPYLFKVLSVRTALSIQSHPDKQLAERLHSERPDIYKDPNHKPEMALALTPFQALCGFVSHEELAASMASTPELATCCGPSAKRWLDGSWTENPQQCLRDAFTALMTCPQEKFREALAALVARIRSQDAAPPSERDQLVLRLDEQYPGDVGVLSSYFLNVVTLKPGECIYLPANEPHAYVTGQLVECMATSDNVIRAGLTPKLRDTEVLCASLTYGTGSPVVLRGDPVAPCRTLYRPPFEEFQIERVDIPPLTEADLGANPGPRIMVVLMGLAQVRASGPCGELPGAESDGEAGRGAVYLIPADTTVSAMASQQGFVAYVASCNDVVFAAAAASPAAQMQTAAA